MNNTTSSPPSDRSSWDQYWQGAQHSHAFSDSGVSHPAIQTFWQNFFNKAKDQQAVKSMLDIASGNGALLELAQQSVGEERFDITCVDGSSAAIDSIRTRFPTIETVVCDANNIPLSDGSFDIVTSQFGIEYAGLSAIDEAVRLLAPGGTLRLMIHYQGGSIAGECRKNRDVLVALIDSKFVPDAIAMFEHGFAAVKGGDRSPYDEAGLKLATTLPVIEGLITNYGALAAGEAIAKLYDDIAKIHQRISHYDADETLAWLTRIEAENAAYLGRMESMLAAAISEEQFTALCDSLEQQGLIDIEAGPLLPHDSNRALAWVITAQRGE